MPDELRRRGRLRQAASWAFSALLLGVVLSQLRSVHLPQRGDIRHPGWLLVAVVSELASMLAAVFVQRVVVAEAGRPPGLRTLTRLTFAATAIGYLLPGGPAVATAWTARQYGRRGVEADTAAGGQVVTGLLIAVVLGGAGTAAFLTSDRDEFPTEVGSDAWIVFGVGSAIVTLVSSAAVILVRRPSVRSWLGRSRLVRRLVGPAAGSPLAGNRALMSGPSVLKATLGTVAVFGLDLGCLLAWLTACAVPTRTASVLSAYAIVAAVSMLPLTPGGLGLVEGGLIGLLVVPAAVSGRLQVAVLGYRLVSYWFVIVLGLLAYAAEQWLSRPASEHRLLVERQRSLRRAAGERGLNPEA